MRVSPTRKAIKNQLLKEIESLKSKKGFLKAGRPRFDRLFGRDSLISAWQMLDKNPEIAKATLEILSQLQGKIIQSQKEEEPGKILHETDIIKKYHPQNHFPFPYYGSVDSTPLFLILFSFYFQKTKDKKFLRTHWENILRALSWIKEYGDRDRDLFLEYQRKTPQGLFHQGWKDGFEDHLKIEPPVAIVEVQGYQYLALIEIAKIVKVFGDKKLDKSLKERAKNLKITFNKKFWLEKERYFALALDGNKKQVKEITSNPGHLLFTGILDKDKEKFVIKKLFSYELWTSFGIRTHSQKSKLFNPLSYHQGSVWPHDNWITAQGLKTLGYKKEEQKIKSALLRAYKELGFLPEYYAVIEGRITLDLPAKPCYPQAWASGALFNFLNG